MVEKKGKFYDILKEIHIFIYFPDQDSLGTRCPESSEKAFSKNIKY